MAMAMASVIPWSFHSIFQLAKYMCLSSLLCLPYFPLVPLSIYNIMRNGAELALLPLLSSSPVLVLSLALFSENFVRMALVVDAEYLKQIEKARRLLRGLISSTQCAPIMLRLA